MSIEVNEKGPKGRPIHQRLDMANDDLTVSRSRPDLAYDCEHDAFEAHKLPLNGEWWEGSFPLLRNKSIGDVNSKIGPYPQLHEAPYIFTVAKQFSSLHLTNLDFYNQISSHTKTHKRCNPNKSFVGNFSGEQIIIPLISTL